MQAGFSSKTNAIADKQSHAGYQYKCTFFKLAGFDLSVFGMEGVLRFVLYICMIVLPGGLSLKLFLWKKK